MRGPSLRTTLATLGVLCALAGADSRVAFADAPTESWATTRARSLVEQGQAHRAAGHVDLALARFREAIEMDGTFGPGYLALADLREATGDLEEAESVLALALDRIPSFSEGLTKRAELFARADKPADATAALLLALDAKPDDEALLAKLIETAPKARLFPVALRAARRLATLCHERGDARAERDATLTALALAMLVGPSDPVSEGARSKERARRALARLTRSAQPSGVRRAAASGAGR
jgi:tetratricopeptide (TPR) repeat protein